SPFAHRSYLPALQSTASDQCAGKGMLEMMRVLKSAFGLCVLAILWSPLASHADEFKLSNNKRISCGRGLSAGKLNTATCRSYAYVFDIKTSEYYRCTVSLALTRNNKEVLNVQSDGSCVKKARIFDTDSNYSFDATETEPPNTNSFSAQAGTPSGPATKIRAKVRA